VRTDLCRILAINLAIISHIPPTGDHLLLFLGQVGVAIFLVCSGMNLHYDGQLLGFYVKRWLRLFPLMTIGVTYMLLLTDAISTIPIASIPFVYLLLGGFVPGGLILFWFVPIVFMYYLIYPLLVRLCRTYRAVILACAISAVNLYLGGGYTFPFLSCLPYFVAGTVMKKDRRLSFLALSLIPTLYLWIQWLDNMSTFYLATTSMCLGVIGIVSILGDTLSIKWSNITYAMYIWNFLPLILFAGLSNRILLWVIEMLIVCPLSFASTNLNYRLYSKIIHSDSA
jgi:hypothetical protein